MVDCSVQDFDIDNDNCTASGGLPVGTDSGIALSCNASVIDKVVNAPKGAIIKNRKGDTLKPLADIAGPVLNPAFIHVDDFTPLYSSVSDGIQCAANQAKLTGKTLYAPDTSKTYILDKPVDLTGIRSIRFESSIDTTALDNTQECVTIGGLAEINNGGFIKFGPFISSNPAFADEETTFPQLVIKGMKGFNFYLDNTRYVQFYAADGDDFDSNAYNSFYLAGRIGLIEMTGDQSFAGQPRWNNENTFYGGRLYKVRMLDNGYPHNHNEFVRPLMEGPFVEITIERGDSNWFKGVRWEGVSSSNGIYFGENTINNNVFMTWISSLQAREMYQNPMKGAPKTDLGKGNVVAYQNAADSQFHTVFSFDSSTTMLSYGSNFDQPSTSIVSGILSSPTIQTGNVKAGVIPGIIFGNKIGVPVAYKQLAESNIIPVKRGSTFGYVANVPSGSWRLFVKAFDENMQLIDDENAINIPVASYQPADAGTWASNDLTSTNEDNTGAQWPLTFSVVSDAVKYIWTSCASGSTANNEIINISCRYYENAQQDFEATAAIDNQPQQPYLNQIPTMGIAELGQIVETGGGQYRCDLSLRTSVVGAVASGSSFIISEDRNSPFENQVAIGDIVGVTLSDHSVHWSIVSDYNDANKSISMSDAIPSGLTVLDGSVAGFCRWISTERGKPYQPKISTFEALPNERYFIQQNLRIDLPVGASVGDAVEIIISSEAVDVPNIGFVQLKPSTGAQITYYDDNGVRQVSSTSITLASNNPADKIWAVSEGYEITAIYNGVYWEVTR